MCDLGSGPAELSRLRDSLVGALDLALGDEIEEDIPCIDVRSKP